MYVCKLTAVYLLSSAKEKLHSEFEASPGIQHEILSFKGDEVLGGGGTHL